MNYLKNNWLKICWLILLAGVISGQLFRITLLSKIALTGTDVAMLISAIVFAGVLFTNKNWRDYFSGVWRSWPSKLLAIFLSVGLASLVINATKYTGGEVFASFSYLARLLLLTFVATGFAYYAKEIEKAFLLKSFVVAGLVALLLGYIQLIFVPDLGFLAPAGWDPHTGRMVSTFLDPNYFAAFLVMVMAVLAGELFNPSRKRNIVAWLIFVICWVGLYLTYSRSGWLTGFLALPLIVWPKSWKTAVLIGVVFVAVVFIPGRFSERIQQSTSYLNTSSVDSGGDFSAAARAGSSKRAIELFQVSPVYGIGYNAYGYAMVKYGILSESDLATRSSMGSDNSFLFVLATTGLVGLGLYLGFYLTALKKMFALRSNRYIWSVFCLSGAYIVGAFFNNILFYVPIAVLWLSLLFMSADWSSDV